MSRRRVVLCTVPEAEDAARIAETLVERSLAACVNVLGGVTSVYRWQGGVERGQERLMVIKTTAERFEALRAAIVELHPDEVPEVIVLTIEAGHTPYLEWIDASCRPPEASG